MFFFFDSIEKIGGGPGNAIAKKRKQRNVCNDVCRYVMQCECMRKKIREKITEKK
jgi:hypothetical protein